MSAPQPIRLMEIWMELNDRKRLLTLMVIHGLSQRDLAEIAGYKSHAYVGKLCRGEAKTMETDPAIRIAHYFRVPVNDLFLTRSASQPEQQVKTRRTRAAA